MVLCDVICLSIVSNDFYSYAESAACSLLSSVVADVFAPFGAEMKLVVQVRLGDLCLAYLLGCDVRV